MFCEESTGWWGSLKTVPVHTEKRRSSNYYVIEYTLYVHPCWLISSDTSMIYGTYDISQHSVHWFPYERIALTIVRNIDIIVTADRAIKLGQIL